MLTVHCQAHITNAHTLVKGKFCFPDGRRASQIVHGKRRSSRFSVWSFWSEQGKAVHGKRSWSKQTCALKRQSNCCPIAKELLHIRSNSKVSSGSAVKNLCALERQSNYCSFGTKAERSRRRSNNRKRWSNHCFHVTGMVQAAFVTKLQELQRPPWQNDAQSCLKA